MTREPGYHEHTVEVRVPVDNEVIVRRVVVNTFARLYDAGFGKRRNKLRKEFTAPAYEFFIHGIVILVRVNRRSFVMIGDLHCAQMMYWKTVEARIELEEDGETVRGES